MKEYIEREAARDLMEQALVDEWEIQYADDRLDEIPAADVVEVVRCKDCKWYQLDPWGYKVQCEKIYDVADGDLDAFYFRPSPEHFCSYGKRKGGDNP